MNDASRPTGSATEAQRAELRHLVRTRRHTTEWREDLFAHAREHGLSETRAIASIAYLRQQPTWDGSPPADATADQITRLRALLAERVAPTPLARSLTERADAGTLAYDAADLAIADLQRLPLRELPAVAAPIGPVPPGYYAVRGLDGTVHTYRVKESTGRPRVKRLDGPNLGMVPAYQVMTVVKSIGADLPAAARLYGQATKHCSDCNQPLRDETQPGWPHGYGPDCWARLDDARRAAILAAAGDSTTNPTAPTDQEAGTQ